MLPKENQAIEANIYVGQSRETDEASLSRSHNTATVMVAIYVQVPICAMPPSSLHIVLRTI